MSSAPATPTPYEQGCSPASPPQTCLPPPPGSGEGGGHPGSQGAPEREGYYIGTSVEKLFSSWGLKNELTAMGKGS